MPTVLQFRRGTTVQNDNFTGSVGEISIDLDKDTLRLHDGATAGGFELTQNDATQTLTNKTLTSPTITGVSPTITLGGDLSGSATLTNLGNATLTATIVANSVTLGTDTTGDYVSSLVAGTGVSLSNNSGEGATPTIAIGQAVGTSDNVTFNNVTVDGTLNSDDITAATMTASGNVVVQGNLTVNGTTTTINSTTLDVDDLNITVAKGAADASAANGGGLTVDGASATFTYASSGDKWTMNKNLDLGSNNFTTTGTFNGNGRPLTNLDASNIDTGTLPSARLSGSYSISVTSATTAGTVTTAAQPNITSVGTLSSLSVTGNVSTGNVSGTLGAFTTVTGNGRALTSLSASNIDTGTLPSGRLSGTYTITVSGSATTAGTVTTAAQPNITSVGTLSSLSVTGNVSTGNVSGTLGAFTTVTGAGSGITSLNASNLSSGTIPDARIQASGVTQHQASLSITESQISDLGTYATAATTITAGTGLSGGGDLSTNRTINVDLSELTDMTATMVGTDEFIVLDAGADRRKAANEIGLSIFSNDAGFSTTTGTVTSVSGTGSVNGLTLSGTVTSSGSLTLGGTLGSITVSQLAAAAVQTSAEAFSDSDTVLMTAAAIEDRILSKGYTTNTGDITGVTAGSGLTGGGSSGSVTLNVGAGSYITVAADSVAVDATSSNTASKVVARDGSGNFSAGTITATLSGTATNATNCQVDADNTTNATHYVTFTGGASGNQRLNSDTGLTYNPSTNTLTTTNFAGTSTSAKYADLAENYVADVDYEPGTVLVLGGEKEVTISAGYASPKLAGIVTTAPAYLMNSALDADNTVGVALVGRVPCKITGTVEKGDLLTSSLIPGVATKLKSGDFVPGCILGKALENYSSDEVGIIEVLVGRI